MVLCAINQGFHAVVSWWCRAEVSGGGHSQNPVLALQNSLLVRTPVSERIETRFQGYLWDHTIGEFDWISFWTKGLSYGIAIGQPETYKPLITVSEPSVFWTLTYARQMRIDQSAWRTKPGRTKPDIIHAWLTAQVLYMAQEIDSDFFFGFSKLLAFLHIIESTRWISGAFSRICWIVSPRFWRKMRADL